MGNVKTLKIKRRRAFFVGRASIKAWTAASGVMAAPSEHGEISLTSRSTQTHGR
jgi:hypothetical protein